MVTGIKKADAIPVKIPKYVIGWDTGAGPSRSVSCMYLYDPADGSLKFMGATPVEVPRQNAIGMAVGAAVPPLESD